MTTFSVEIWALLATVGALALVGMLYVLAADAREQIRMHDLKRRVNELHGQYVARLAAMRARAQAMEELEKGEGVEGDYDLVEEPADRRAA